MIIQRFFLICVMVLFAGVALAEDAFIVDAPGGPNDPTVNDDANACFRGGVLAGKCSSTDVDMDGDVDAFDLDWMWRAGWHRIRYDFNLITYEEFEATIPYYLPILPGQTLFVAGGNAGTGGGGGFPPYAGAAAGCYLNTATTLYLNWGGGTGPAGSGSTTYSDPACTVPSGTALVNYVASDSQARADFLCGGVATPAPHTPNPPGGTWYAC